MLIHEIDEAFQKQCKEFLKHAISQRDWHLEQAITSMKFTIDNDGPKLTVATIRQHVEDAKYFIEGSYEYRKIIERLNEILIIYDKGSVRVD